MSTKRLTRRQKRQHETEVENVLNKKFAMKRISAMTQNQQKVIDAYEEGYHLANIGSAGTGKTYLSMALALEEVMESENFQQIIIVRSAVQSRDQGFMPGSLSDKMGYYETPYQDIVNDLFGRGDAYQILKSKGMLKFMSTSFVRGLTFDKSIIIVDECQNMRYDELRTVMTRVGESSRIIFCGDTKQDDLACSKNRLDTSGLAGFMRILRRMNKSFDIIEFTVDDIVRSGIVKEFIIAEENEMA